MPWWWAVVVVVVVIATALWWWLPKWQVNLLRLEIPDAKARADVEDNFRKTIGQLLGGAAVLVGTGFAYYESQLAQQATHDQLKATYDQIEASKAQVISQQVSKGFEQLGSDKLVVRLGGIYALEGVMNTSQQYHQPVLEALCAFVRDNTPPSWRVLRENTKAKIDKDKTKAKGPESPATATDIQAALTVIGRREAGPGIVDLRHANLSYANLTGAKLYGANLTLADLSNANLSYANLTGAMLIVADLTHTNLTGANLTGANGLDQKQLNEACGDKDTKLPSGLTIQQCHSLLI